MDFLDELERFNRRERFFLVGWALGKPGFELDPEFAKTLGAIVGFDVPTTAAAFMDYPFDWLQAAVFRSHAEYMAQARYPNPEKLLNSGNQEDIDLLVAFRAGAGYRLILIEAKAETRWLDKQLKSKRDRMIRVFGESGAKAAGIHPTLLLTSPAPPVLRPEEWPEWMVDPSTRVPRWTKLKMPDNRLRVVGCNEQGHKSKTRTHFMFREQP